MNSTTLHLPSLDAVKAILFDIDGTLADTDPIHFRVFEELLLSLGRVKEGEFDKDFFHKHISGRTNDSIFRELFPDWDNERITSESAAKEQRFRSIAATSIVPLKGLDFRTALASRNTPDLMIYSNSNNQVSRRLLDLTRWTKDKGIKAVAVTNAPRENAEIIISAIGLSEYFDDVVIGTECARAKPFPDPYQEALRRLGLAPGDAIAFEDSPTGLQAAVAAGVATVGVLTSQSPSVLKAAGASITINDFSAPSPWDYLQIEREG